MRLATALLLTIGALFVSGCSLLIGSELAGKDATSGAGGQGGAGETSSFASTSAGMMMPATSAQSASASSASASASSGGGGCMPACKLPNAMSACVNGACVITQCNDHFGDCNLEASDGCELNLNDDNNCGSCKKMCMQGESCKGAKCK